MKALLKYIRRSSPSRQRFQVLSDLHLEVGQQYSSFKFPSTAPVLILAGDIGRLVDYDGYLKFLEAQVVRYTKVFLVLGNHEFYGLDYEAGMRKAQCLSEEPSISRRLILLNRARWDDNSSNLIILGCTLWSSIPEDAYKVVESKVNDFKKICGWTVQKHNMIHDKEVAWLSEQVGQVMAEGRAGNTAKQLLVVTHHAPCVNGTSKPEYSSNPWASAFATDLLDQGRWDGIGTWLFGHTHYSTDFIRNGIRVVANQRGYVLPGSVTQRQEREKLREKGAHEFNASMVITI